jgi:FtsH-binding integral membrane protein
MASIPRESLARPTSTPFLGRNGLLDMYFYFAMSLLAAAIVIWGFSHSIDANLLHAAVPRPLLLWIHSAVFSLWIVFFIVQSALVRTHHVRWHRTLGWFGLALGVSMVFLGFVTAVVMGRFDTHRLHQQGADAFLIVPFYDMLAFAIFFGLAIYWRRKPELHRRLIFIATCGLLDAAFGRIDFLLNHDIFFWCLDAVILLGVARDLLVNRRIHPVYRVALPALVIMQSLVIYAYRDSALWLRIGHSILQ